MNGDTNRRHCPDERLHFATVINGHLLKPEKGKILSTKCVGRLKLAVGPICSALSESRSKRAGGWVPLQCAGRIVFGVCAPHSEILTGGISCAWKFCSSFLGQQTLYHPFKEGGQKNKLCTIAQTEKCLNACQARTAATLP